MVNKEPNPNFSLKVLRSCLTFKKMKIQSKLYSNADVNHNLHQNLE